MAGLEETKVIGDERKFLEDKPEEKTFEMPEKGKTLEPLANDLEPIQDEVDKQQKAMLDYYNTNVVEALKDGDLNGMKLDRKRQAEFYNRLTVAKPSPISGKPVNSIGEALERIQFSDNPNYKLLIHVDWMLNDPEGYWAAIKQIGKNEGGVEIERKLKRKKECQIMMT